MAGVVVSSMDFSTTVLPLVEQDTKGCVNQVDEQNHGLGVNLIGGLDLRPIARIHHAHKPAFLLRHWLSPVYSAAHDCAQSSEHH